MKVKLTLRLGDSIFTRTVQDGNRKEEFTESQLEDYYGDLLYDFVQAVVKQEFEILDNEIYDNTTNKIPVYHYNVIDEYREEK